MKLVYLTKSLIVFFIVTTFIILTLNLTPLISHLRHAPAGRTFPMIHNNVQDYYFYLALMNEGGSGAWLTSDPYTSEPHQPSIIFSYFLWLGKLSKLLNLSYAVAYHLIRIILGILFLFSIFYFLFSIRIPYPRIAYLFFLFAAPFMHTINDYGTLRSVPFMSWWNGVDPIRRAAFLPHHMLGGFLLIISIILIFKFIATPTRAAVAKLILISAIMAFVHTPSLLIMLLVLPSSIFFYLILNKVSPITNYQLPITKSIDLLIYWFIGLLFLFAMISQTKSGFPWSQYIDWERKLQFPLDRELIGALGILLPFSILGVFNALKSKKFEYIFIACWLIVPFLFIPIAPKLNLSNIRLIQGVPYLPLAILAVLGIKSIENFITKYTPGVVLRLRHTPGVEKSEKSDRTPKLILIGVVVIFFIFTYPTLQWSLKDQIREYWPIWGNVYLDNRLFAVFDFINNNFPAKTITLSTFYAGNYLPAYTNTISFIGHFGYTYNQKEKEIETQRFLQGKMTGEEAKNFLLSNKIALIFQGPEEKPLYKDYLYPNLLKIVYDKEEATLYKPNF